MSAHALQQLARDAEEHEYHEPRGSSPGNPLLSSGSNPTGKSVRVSEVKARGERVLYHKSKSNDSWT